MGQHQPELAKIQLDYPDEECNVNINVLRIGLAAFWLVIGVGILLRAYLGLANLDERIESRSLNLFGFLGVSLAGWNLLRWWFSRPRTMSQNALREKIATRRKTEHPEEYIPELDFTKAPVEPPKPAP